MKPTTVIKTLLSSVALVALVATGTAYAKNNKSSSPQPKQETHNSEQHNSGQETKSQSHEAKQQTKTENKQQKQETKADNKAQKQETKADNKAQKQENKQQKQEAKQEKKDAPGSSEKKGVLKKVGGDVVKGAKAANKVAMKDPVLRATAKGAEKGMHAERTFMDNHPDVKEGVKIVGKVGAWTACPECQATKVGLKEADKGIKAEQKKAEANGKSGEVWGIANKVDKGLGVANSAQTWGVYGYGKTSKYENDAKAITNADNEIKRSDKAAKDADKAATKAGHAAEVSDQKAATADKKAEKARADGNSDEANRHSQEADKHRTDANASRKERDDHRDRADTEKKNNETAKAERANISSASKMTKALSEHRGYNLYGNGKAAVGGDIATWGSVAAGEMTKDPKGTTAVDKHTPN